MRLLPPATAVALVLGLVHPGATVSAEDREAGQYIVAVTPVIGFRMGGSFDGEDSEGADTGQDVEVDDDAMAGVIINRPFQSVSGDDYTEWEFYFARQSAGLDTVPEGVDPGLELDITHYLIGGTYVGGGDRVRPYLAAGIGAAHISPDGPGYDSDTVFGFGLGVGAQVFPASRVGLRFEGRMLGSLIDSDSAIFCATGPQQGATCAFRASGDALLQWEVFAGLTIRL